MKKILPLSPYLLFGFGIFLNFFWLFFRQELPMPIQLIFLCTTILIILVSSFLGAITQKGKKKLLFLHGGQWILFTYYLYILSMLLFFGGLFQIDRSYQGEFQLVPFHTIENYVNFYNQTGSIISYYNLLGNLILMMPLGYFIPTLFPKIRKFYLFLPIAALFALGVEFIQWKTGTGIGDIDDSILNFLGAVFAYACTRTIQLIHTALKTD